MPTALHVLVEQTPQPPVQQSPLVGSRAVTCWARSNRTNSRRGMLNCMVGFGARRKSDWGYGEARRNHSRDNENGKKLCRCMKRRCFYRLVEGLYIFAKVLFWYFF